MAASIGKVACNVTPCVQLFVLFSWYGMQMVNQVTKIFSSKGNGFLKQVSTSKSLGVDIDGNLSWECHINEISKKIAFGKSVIKRIRYFLPFEILLNVYNSLVQPHFDYCNVVWENCSKNLSSTLQNRVACVLSLIMTAVLVNYFKI